MYFPLVQSQFIYEILGWSGVSLSQIKHENNSKVFFENNQKESYIYLNESKGWTITHYFLIISQYILAIETIYFSNHV